MRMTICWILFAAAVAAIVVLDGARGLIPFVAADSFVAVAAAIGFAAIYRGGSMHRMAVAALAGGALATAVNVAITLMREGDPFLVPQRLALGMTGLLYGAAAAAAFLALAARRETVQVKI